MHINAIGAYRPDMRELDGPLIASSQVVVETPGTALAEAGDVIQAISEGICAMPPASQSSRTLCAAGSGGAMDDGDGFQVGGDIPVEDLVVARAAIRLLVAGSATAGAGDPADA